MSSASQSGQNVPSSALRRHVSYGWPPRPWTNTTLLRFAPPQSAILISRDIAPLRGDQKADTTPDQGWKKIISPKRYGRSVPPRAAVVIVHEWDSRLGVPKAKTAFFLTLNKLSYIAEQKRISMGGCLRPPRTTLSHLQSIPRRV